MRDYKLFNNPYNFLKSDEKKLVKNCKYADELTRFLITMFEYEKSGIYKDINDATIERILILNGTCGFWKIDNKIVCGLSSAGGLLDENGVGTLITGTLLNGKGCKGINMVDAVLGWNNSTLTSDYDILLFADKFTEADISEDCIIRNARKSPIFSVKNSKIKKALDNILKNIYNGKSNTITDDTITLTDKKSIEIIDITDSQAIDKLQYLCTYHNDLLRRFYTKYGQALGEGVKLAQQSVAEVNSNISSSFINPLDRLKQRVTMCENLEKTFGKGIKVRFSEPWRIEFEKWSNITDNAIDGIFDNDVKGGVSNENN